MSWIFPQNNDTDVNGIGHSGIETFLGTPLKSLAREICQNSLDAAEKTSKGAVVIEFESFCIPQENFQGRDSLEDAFHRSFEFWKPKHSTRTEEFFKQAIKTIKQEKIPFLRISDFNTSGLVGSRKEYQTPWHGLTKSSGASDKVGTAGGSFGIGKFAPYACSDFRTVFYSTNDIEGNQASQGISRITSFKREDNKITLGLGYYGEPHNKPFHSQKSLDPNFSRDKDTFGTDIFITGFRYADTNWKEDIIISILDGFLYSVLSGKMEVRVGDVIINKNSLPQIFEDYQDILRINNGNADKYYDVLTSKKTRWSEIDYRQHGKIHLGLIIQEDMHRKVAMIRQTGMKIMDRGHISGTIPFAGVLFIEGEQVNQELLKLENPQHNNWEPERSDNPTHAKIYINGIVSFIKEELKKLVGEIGTETIDPSVGEFLPDIYSEEQGAKEEQESLSTEVKNIDKKVIRKKTQTAEIATKGTDDGEMISETGEILDTIETGGAGRRSGNKIPITKGGDYPGINDGENEGPNPKVLAKTKINIVAEKVRVFCINPQEGSYSVSFTPSVTSENAEISLYLVAESGKYPAPLVDVRSLLPQKNMEISKNIIKGLGFIKGDPVRFIVRINYYDYCSMEVTASGYPT